MSKIKDITGQRFGMLVVTEFAKLKQEPTGRRAYWKAVCDCGNEGVFSGKDLRNGHTKSCGCMKYSGLVHDGGALRTHGLRNSAEYEIWRGIKKRCFTPSNPSYRDYGGRGITVCPEWRESFEAFYRDMGQRPSDKHSIDRIDVNGPYCKDNCRWATWVEQNSNRRNTTRVQLDTETVVTMTELSSMLGTYPTSAHYHLQKAGRSLDEFIAFVSAKQLTNETIIAKF